MGENRPKGEAHENTVHRRRARRFEMKLTLAFRVKELVSWYHQFDGGGDGYRNYQALILRGWQTCAEQPGGEAYVKAIAKINAENHENH